MSDWCYCRLSGLGSPLRDIPFKLSAGPQCSSPREEVQKLSSEGWLSKCHFFAFTKGLIVVSLIVICRTSQTMG